jgi:hypothetical protein
VYIKVQGRGFVVRMRDSASVGVFGLALNNPCRAYPNFCVRGGLISVLRVRESVPVHDGMLRRASHRSLVAALIAGEVPPFLMILRNCAKAKNGTTFCQARFQDCTIVGCFTTQGVRADSSSDSAAASAVAAV